MFSGFGDFRILSYSRIVMELLVRINDYFRNVNVWNIVLAIAYKISQNDVFNRSRIYTHVTLHTPSSILHICIDLNHNSVLSLSFHLSAWHRICPSFRPESPWHTKSGCTWLKSHNLKALYIIRSPEWTTFS